MILVVVLLLSSSLQVSEGTRQPLQLVQDQQGYPVTHTGSSSLLLLSYGTTRLKRALQQQQPALPEQTVTHVFLTFEADPANVTERQRNSSATEEASTAAAAGSNSTGQETAAAAAAAAPAAAAASTPAPSDASWQQRRTLQLPPHVYLISFVMLLAIMAGLLTCHCWRMCRIARRMRQAAELGVTISAAGAMLSKRTPQSVIESLPVAKYSIIHNQRLAKTGPSMGKSSAAGQPGGAESSSNAFLAAAMQIREQLTRQSGINTFNFSRSGSSAAATAAAASAQRSGSNAARSSFTGDGREISPAITDSSSSVTSASGATQPDTAAAAVASSLQDSSTASVAVQAVQDSSSRASQDSPAAAALTPPPPATVAATAITLSRAGSSKQVNAGLSSNGAEPCAICFEDFTDNDDVKQLPCSHFYHCSCIDEWLVRDVTCPLCKAPVLDEQLLQQQQLMAAALEASFGNMHAAARRQQQAQRDRRRANDQGTNSSAAIVGLGAPAATSDSGSAERGSQGVQREQQRIRESSLRHSRSSTARELLELTGLAMLQLSGRRGGSRRGRNRGNANHSSSTTQQEQQQVEGGQAQPADVEMGASAVQRS